MIVFGSTLSPYVRKVMVFGAEKGLEMELRPAGLGQGGPEFEAASPFRKMPGFKDGDFSISDSTAIVTYLEARYPEPNLIPDAPEARARTIWFDELADTMMMAAGGAIFFNRFVGPRILKQECNHAAADAADISIASPVATLGTIGVHIDAGRWPKLAAYIDAIHARPSFAPIVEKDRALVAQLGGPVEPVAA